MPIIPLTSTPHPYSPVMASMILAGILKEQGKLREAEGLYRQCMTVRKGLYRQCMTVRKGLYRQCMTVSKGLYRQCMTVSKGLYRQCMTVTIYMAL